MATSSASRGALCVQEGYPAEEHRVTTRDGYILRMERIPRRGCRRVTFFVHGVMDTSLSWVATGTIGSMAYAAFDAGADVWLANCRSNPPREHADPAFRGVAYWSYSVNELGLQDMNAQVCGCGRGAHPWPRAGGGAGRARNRAAAATHALGPSSVAAATGRACALVCGSLGPTLTRAGSSAHSNATSAGPGHSPLPDYTVSGLLHEGHSRYEPYVTVRINATEV